MEYLEVEEMNAILKVSNKAKSQRDFVLLSLMYNTGARVQEICDLKISDLYLNNPSFVTITGKGNKTRQVPIWESTQKILEHFLKKEALNKCHPVNTDEMKSFLKTNKDVISWLDSI